MYELNEAGWQVMFDDQRRERSNAEDEFIPEPDTPEYREAQCYQIFNQTIDGLCSSLHIESTVFSTFMHAATYELPAAAKRAKLPLWRLNAGIMNCLHLITESAPTQCAAHMQSVILPVTSSILLNFEENPIMRMAAGIVLAQLAEDLRDDLAPYIPECVHMLTQSIMKDPSPQVVEYSRDCAINLFTGSEADVKLMLGPVAALLIPNAVEAITSRSGEWSQALVFLAGASAGLRADFEPFYPAVMDLLLSLLRSPELTSLALKRALTAASVVIANAEEYKIISGDSIGSRFPQDLQTTTQIVQDLVSRQQLQLADRSVVTAVLRLAVALGEHAAPVVDFALPPLLLALAAPPAITFQHDHHNDHPLDGQWTQLQIGDQQVSINTSDIERRTTISDALITYTDNAFFRLQHDRGGEWRRAAFSYFQKFEGAQFRPRRTVLGGSSYYSPLLQHHPITG
jgi:hypothetical protein